MTNYFLPPTQNYFGINDDNDFAVLVGRRVVGRVFLSSQAPPDRGWVWTITAPERPASIHNRGYSATREGAMLDLKARWLERSTRDTL